MVSPKIVNEIECSVVLSIQSLAVESVRLIRQGLYLRMLPQLIQGCAWTEASHPGNTNLSSRNGTKARNRCLSG